jgi:hypothetical protein
MGFIMAKWWEHHLVMLLFAYFFLLVIMPQKPSWRWLNAATMMSLVIVATGFHTLAWRLVGLRPELGSYHQALVDLKRPALVALVVVLEMTIRRLRRAGVSSPAEALDKARHLGLAAATQGLGKEALP